MCRIEGREGFVRFKKGSHLGFAASDVASGTIRTAKGVKDKQKKELKKAGW
jgi:hypothetical protein